MNILNHFFDEIENKSIRYCHWKSINRMDEVFDGKTDIDLLIDHKDSSAFRSILSSFKAMPVRPRMWMCYPSMEDYLIYDSSSGIFYHLHLHYRLIMGKKNAKEYVLPLDEYYLKTRIKHDKYDTYIVNPELDLIVLLLRYSIKYSLFTKYYQKLRNIKTAELKEVQFLLPLCNESKLIKTAKDMDSILGTENEIYNFINHHHYLNLSKNIRKISSLKKSIKKYKRLNSLETLSIRKLRKYLNLFAAIGRNNAKHPVQGGVTIAIVGADGSGKTTVTDALIKELRIKLSAKKYYMGFNSRSYSLKTRILALISYFPRSAKFILKNNLGKKINILGQFIIEYGGYLDRKKLYLKALRDKANGMIVFFERYPLKDTIDYPQFLFNSEDLKIIEKSRFLTKLKNILEKKYSIFKPADINVFIKTNPEIIRQRRKMSIQTFNKIKVKFNRVDQYVENQEHFFTVDGTQSLNKVILDIKNIIFSEL